MKLYCLLSIILLLIGCGEVKSDSTLDQKIAKMLIVGFDGVEYSETNRVVKDVRDIGVGGIIIFERNITPVEQGKNSIDILRDMCGKLQGLRTDNLLISIDQEGGRVTRLKTKYGFPKFVSAKYLGDLDNLDSTSYYAHLTAKWLKDLNINTNFAPCVDVIANESCPVIARLDRAYSKDEGKVVNHALSVVKQSAQMGVYTSLKHFPGHGSSEVDSHKGFTDVSDSWSERELIPFTELINEGTCPMIMVGHLFNDTLDDKYPASLSDKTLNGLLREKLNWQGVIVTDDMLMGAIADNYEFKESVMLAINAGCDMFIYSGNIPKSNMPISELFIKTVKELIAEGNISEQRIDESYNRINNMLSSKK